MSQGDFCWFDLMSTDVPAARVFYTALFGWSVTSHNPEYAMIQDRHGRTLGGMMAAAPGMPSAGLAYVTVDDLDDTLRKVKDAGAIKEAGPFTEGKPVPIGADTISIGRRDDGVDTDDNADDFTGFAVPTPGVTNE